MNVCKTLEKNGESLQNVAWVKQNEYSDICNCMIKSPNVFKLEKGKTLAENVELAEKLAEENGGVLQSSKWLQQNGHKEIIQCMTIYPKAFRHIKQESKRNN